MAAARAAERLCTLASQKKAAKKKLRVRRQKKLQQQNLPAPVDVQQQQEPASQPEPETLASRVKKLWGPKAAEAVKEYSTSPLENFSENYGEPLSPESEQLLARVPETVSAEAEGLPEPLNSHIDSLPPDQGDPIAALMAQVAFEEQDVKDLLCELFEWLAERFESEHWKLTDRQTRMLGRPAAQMANSIWQKLQEYIPDILGKWCEETPGATAFILACGIVIGPKVTKQFAISRERKNKVNLTRPSQSHNAEPEVQAPQPAKRSGMIWSKGEEAAA